MAKSSTRRRVAPRTVQQRRRLPTAQVATSPVRPRTADHSTHRPDNAPRRDVQAAALWQGGRADGELAPTDRTVWRDIGGCRDSAQRHGRRSRPKSAPLRLRDRHATARRSRAVDSSPPRNFTPYRPAAMGCLGSYSSTSTPPGSFIVIEIPQPSSSGSPSNEMPLAFSSRTVRLMSSHMNDTW